MRNKHPKGWMDTPHHIEFLRKDENDERRDKRRCLFFTKNKCSYYNGQCIGSSHCNYYQEDKQKASKRSSKATTHRTSGRRPSKKPVCADPIAPEKLMFKNTLLEAQRRNVQAMYNVAQFYEYGKGVQQDYEQAEYWYKLAADNGNPYAVTAIQQLNEKYPVQKRELPELQNDSVKENKNDVVAVSAASQNSSPNDAQEIIEDSLTLEKEFFKDNNELSVHAGHETQTTQYISQPDISQPDREQSAKVVTQNHELRKTIFQYLIFISAVCITIFSVYYAVSHRNSSSPATPSVKQVIQKKPPLGTKENPSVITAEGLMGKYNENISETNSKYKGKYVKVSGTVIHQGKFNNSNNIAVYIYRWNFNGKRYDILGAINEKNKEWTRNIKEGSSVVITGKFIGAVEQKNKNVISLQILVSQLPQVKDK